MMKRIRFWGLGLLTVFLLGSIWLFRFDLSFGPIYAEYDLWVTDTLDPSPRVDFKFGNHSLMAGSFRGDALNVGIRSEIPDSAEWIVITEFPYYDPKFEYRDEQGYVHYNGPPVPDPPEKTIRIPVRSRLPKRSMNQRYLFHFTLYPRDSVHLEILVHDKTDCSLLPKLAATAYLREGPCSF